MKKTQVNDCEDVLLSMRMIAENLSEVINRLDIEAIRAMIQKILEGERVFVMGAGRSGLVAKAFAMISSLFAIFRSPEYLFLITCL
jgi:6-phospho-3-hexuloisomerase